jgi:hypothetical protein
MMKVKTVDRLRAGIAVLTARGDPVAAKTIERETRLTFQTIRRNDEAYGLFCEYADSFRSNKPGGGRGMPARRSTARRGANRNTVKRVPSARPRDPLLGYTKQKLVDRSRALEQRIAQLEGLLGRRGAREQQLEAENMQLRAELVHVRK